MFTIEQDLVSFGIPNPLIVFIISMLPISELRGAIPVGIFNLNMPWYYTLPIAYIGNLVPVPLLYIFLDRLRRLSKHMGIIGTLVEKFLKYTNRRAAFIERYGKVGLILFVALPLPITGAWTGTIAAYLLGIRFRDAILPICTGVLIAGIVVTIISVQSQQGQLNWVATGIACAILVTLGVIWLWLRKRHLDKQNDIDESL